MTKRTAVLLLTHHWNRLVRTKLARMRKEIGDRAEVIPVLQRSPESDAALARYPDKGGTGFTFDAEHLPGFLGYPYYSETLVPGSTHYPLLAFFRTRPDYAFYFVVENDVVYSGNWGGLIERVTAAAPDFATSHLTRHADDPEWYWWHAIEAPEGARDWVADTGNLLKSFNPVLCASQHALGVVDRAHRDGWRGHYEVLFATLMARNGCKLADLKDLGEYYQGTEQNPHIDLPRAKHSTMRWRPRVTTKEFRERSDGHTLFHPVKDPWMFDGKRIIAFRIPGKQPGKS